MRIPDTAVEIARRCREGSLCPLDVVEETFARIEAAEPSVEAFLHVDREGARRRAKALIHQGPRSGERGLLYGVPLAVKDNICVEGSPLSCGSRILEGYVAPYQATVIEKILNAGAIVVGKTNMDEFAMGSSTESSAYKNTLNPRGSDLSPGGSSGGSAAAVAAGAVPLALGSDTGGSIRQPAALCGVVGLKPTYGAVSRYGLVAFASSLDQIGPLAATVSDSALLFAVIAGPDQRDSTSRPDEGPDSEDLLAALEEGIEGLRIGVPAQYLSSGVQGEVVCCIEQGLRFLQSRGALLVEIDLPHTAHAIPAYYLIATSEASSNLARYDGVRYGPRADAADLRGAYRATRRRGFGREVIRRIMLGTFALSAGYADDYYLEALEVRDLVARDFAEAFEEVDLIAGATTPAARIGLGEKTGDPLSMYLCDALTTPASLAGLPALSVPCGPSENGSPVGLQIVGRAGDEVRVLQAARTVERTRASS